MERSSSRWRFLNPMETLKAIYEALGSPHPKLSLIAVFIVCGAVGAGIWWFLGMQVAKDRQAETSPPQALTSGAASTSGAKSPAVTGGNNQIQYGQSSPPEKKKPPK